MEPLKRKGTILEGPNGHAYRLTEDVFPYTRIMVEQFEPIGDSPKPVAGDVMPGWLQKEIENKTE